MKRKNQLSDIFEQCLEKIISRKATIEQCLAEYPDLVEELKPLLLTALAVKKAVSLQPSTEVASRVRYRINSEINTAKVKRGFSFNPRWAITIAGILVFLLGGSGTLAAAASSMPDSALYPVKLATEEIQVKLTPSKIARAELFVKQADRRVAEIAYMANEDNPEKVEQLTQSLDKALTNVTVLASENQNKMAAPPASTSPGQKGFLSSGASVSTPADSGSEAAVPTPSIPPAPVITAPPQARGNIENSNSANPQMAKLEEKILNAAINHPAALRAALEKASPKTRQALLQAIKVSQQGYEEALKAVENNN